MGRVPGALGRAQQRQPKIFQAVRGDDADKHYDPSEEPGLQKATHVPHIPRGVLMRLTGSECDAQLRPFICAGLIVERTYGTR